jgi:serine acetyltransferase
VRIGSRVFIGPGCTVVRDLPDDTRVSSPPIRIRAA